jgi:hypothetical protein
MTNVLTILRTSGSIKKTIGKAMSHETPQAPIHFAKTPSFHPSALKVLTPDMMHDIMIDNTKGKATVLYFAGSFVI